MSDFVQGRLRPEDALLFLDAIEQDPDASADLDLHVEVLNIARSEDAEVFRVRPEMPRAAGVKGVSGGSWWGWLLEGRRVFVPAGILLAALLVGFAFIAFGPTATNPFGDLADLGDPGASFRMRGWGDADLADAATWLTNGDPGEAARRFERYLRMYPSSEWVPWVEYAAGVSRLAEARRAFLGIRVRYEVDEVRRGLDHLDRVLAHAGVPDLMEDALWYRAKGSLMLGDARNAEVYLTRILASQGSRSPAAQKLLSDLHSLHY